jgi:hypothetical protein
MKKIKIRNKLIGEEEPCFIIAEAGSKGSFGIMKITNLTKVVRSVRKDSGFFQRGKGNEPFINTNIY